MPRWKSGRSRGFVPRTLMPMSFTIWMGLAAVVFAGILQGLFAVPMKYATRWNYEHIWVTYGFAGMIVLPWLLTTATVPHLAEVYSLTSTSSLVRIAGFGLCWGIGSVLAGLGMNLLGPERVIGITHSAAYSYTPAAIHSSRPSVLGRYCDYAGGNRHMRTRRNVARCCPQGRPIGIT